MSLLRTNSNGSGNGRPSLADFLTARPSGLEESESWAVLCQAVQALQDLFLSDGAFGSSCVPLVTPQTLLFSLRGRVKLCPSRHVFEGKPPVHLMSYLAPEYRTKKHFTDTEMEKMWVFALGETLKRATLTSHVATSRLSAELCQLLTDMTRLQATARASLMHLLDIISNYCVKRQQHRPFSHIVMDLYQETVSALEVVMESSWGPPAMPQLQPRTINWTDPTTDNYGTIPRRWMGLTRAQEMNFPKLTREASTSMDDLAYARAGTMPGTVPGSVARPKSMYVEGHGLHSDVNVISDNNFFNQIPLEPRRDDDAVCRGGSGGTIGNKGSNNRRLKVRRNPVQRAASRLYRVKDESQAGNNKECVGPEFVVRASLPSRQLLMTDVKVNNGKIVTIIMLDGQKLDVLCNPHSTAGHLFEQIIQKEHIEENFMFGLSALISGDFVFLPSDTRISKVLQDEHHQGAALTLFLRVRFFLPSLRGFRGNEAKHLLYLQLRRSIIEHQLPCTFKQIVELNGFALQAEFGDYNPKEHGQRDYFLLEHYIPESMSSVIEDSAGLRQELIRAHVSKSGVETRKAEENFITLAQSLPHYGGHFYTATWMNKDNNHKDIWLYISAQGMSLYERGNHTSQFGPILYEKFEWRNIQTLCYSKQYLCILPHTDRQSKFKLKKYKLKMDQKKSYFTFRLASLHHQFFMRFRTEYISPQTLSQQFGIPLKDIKNETNSMCKLDGLLNTETAFEIDFRTSSRIGGRAGRFDMKKSKSIGDFNESVNERDQNKENETTKRAGGLVLESKHLSGLPPNGSADKRRGVKMGTRAFSSSKAGLSRSMEAVNKEYLEEMSLQSVSLHCSSTSVSRSPTGKCTPDEAFILDSTIKHSSQPFLPDFQETVSESLLEKLDDLSVVEERLLVNVSLTRDPKGSFGLQITEGSDGHVYVQSVIAGGPAFCTGNFIAGDQIIAVNGKSLLGARYDRALDVLKTSGDRIDFVLARHAPDRAKRSAGGSPVEKHLIENCRDASNVGKYGAEEVPYHKHIRYEIGLGRSLSKSCTSLERSNGDRAVVVEMIPKGMVDFEEEGSTRPVALPRCLGLSRRWKGPVKYPVTPVKKTTINCDSSYLSTSDEEQIFI
ncbi:unnamed protein product [Phyllotreta striolata]|uniref:Tyrosine-protein phosphatase non-receptor type 13 n=1 Tax=Phyllotreta striolata TaxID=444603 RepID=A0A9N9TB95_PHYSR|nr:unnamed protein product [Phyllotreta striolata]